ncbi:MAG: hypothetical protein AAF337_12135, partial [Pseudomonadota bacterium]
MKALLETLTRISCRFNVITTLLGLGLAGLGLWIFVTRLAVVTDTDAMIEPSLPYRQAYSDFQQAYPQLGDTLAIVVESEAPELRQRAAEALVKALLADEKHFQGVYAPQTLDFFKAN